MKTNKEKKIVRRAGEARITTTRQIGKEAKEQVSHTHHLIADDLPEHPAYVRVDGGLTVNLGNYESARIGVSISVPCHPTKRSIDQTYAAVSDMVSEKLEEESRRLDGPTH